jgi:hypothetical protein
VIRLLNTVVIDLNETWCQKCAGEIHQQFNRSTGEMREKEREDMSESQRGHFPVEEEWPVVVGPFLSSKRPTSKIVKVCKEINWSRNRTRPNTEKRLCCRVSAEIHSTQPEWVVRPSPTSKRMKTEAVEKSLLGAVTIQWLLKAEHFVRYSDHTNSVAFSSQANYADWSTATCWRNLVPTFADRGVSHGQRGGSPTVVNLSFLDRSCYFSFK